MDSQGEATSRNNTASLLIVEDDTAACDITGRMIALHFPGLAIYKAADGAAGVEQFRKHAPQIVITDIGMPVMDGIEMAREIKALSPETRFIVLTAYSEKSYVDQFNEIGHEAYLLKPLNLDLLIGVIERCLKEIAGAG